MGGCVCVVAGDITHDEGAAVRAECNDVVPVRAEPEGVTRGLVAHCDVEPIDQRRRGEQRRLERTNQIAAFVAGPVAFENVADPVGHSFIADVKDKSGRDAINEGDLIQRINRLTVTDLKSFNEVVAKLKTGDAVVMHIASYNPRYKAVQQRIVQFTVQ